MTGVGVGFGLALGVAAILAGKSPTRSLSTACVAMLGIGWVVAVVTAPVAAHADEILLSWAVLDAVFGATCMGLWSRNRHPWLLMLVFTYFGQSFLHVQYWTGHIPAPRLYNYQLWVNLLLVAQIWCVAWPGAEHVAGRVFDRAFPVPRARHRSRPSKGPDK